MVVGINSTYTRISWKQFFKCTQGPKSRYKVMHPMCELHIIGALCVLRKYRLLLLLEKLSVRQAASYYILRWEQPEFVPGLKYELLSLQI